MMRAAATTLLLDLLDALTFLGNPTLANAVRGGPLFSRSDIRSREIADLARRGYLEFEPGANPRKDRILRLTAKGRLQALGGRDPEACWSRPWDGQWRLIIFDIPESSRNLRDRLRRYLHARHFGCLQNSVWVSPDPLDLEHRLFKGTEINTERLLTLDAKPGTGEKNSDIVQGAWNFEAINQAYEDHLKILNTPPPPTTWTATGEHHPLSQWIQAERDAWQAAVNIDPLLPRAICPPSYLGQKSWELRRTQLTDISQKVAATPQNS